MALKQLCVRILQGMHKYYVCVYLCCCLDNEMFVAAPTNGQDSLALVVSRRLSNQEIAVLGEKPNHFFSG